ncbi:MAG: HigA family addiction module antitoxin [Bryobacterales bacterium]|nr:HigA family addiction module antitoxin [Bryobacterales bacterium]
MGEWVQALAPEELRATVNRVRYNSPHPGKILRSIRFEDPRTIPEAAEQLGVERTELERVLDGEAPITTALALSMESAWNTRADLWLDLQTDHDLAQARRSQERAAA